jgi:hypothetical protein
MVALGDGRFEPRELELGLDSGDGWLEVLSGLEEGEDVGVSGQFLIDSESNLREAVRRRLSDAEPAAPAGPADPPMLPIDHSVHGMEH